MTIIIVIIVNLIVRYHCWLSRDKAKAASQLTSTQSRDVRPSATLQPAACCYHASLTAIISKGSHFLSVDNRCPVLLRCLQYKHSTSPSPSPRRATSSIKTTKCFLNNRAPLIMETFCHRGREVGGAVPRGGRG